MYVMLLVLLRARITSSLQNRRAELFKMATATSSGVTHGRNRLAKEKSPYLLQHASNPVDWLVRTQVKLLLLPAGYQLYMCCMCVCVCVCVCERVWGRVCMYVYVPRTQTYFVSLQEYTMQATILVWIRDYCVSVCECEGRGEVS